MAIKILVSDQLDNWSEYNERIIYFLSLSATQSVVKATYTVKFEYGKRLFNRALQALWKSWLSLCTREGTWPKIFSIYKFSKNQAGNDLRTISLQKAYRRRIKQLSKSQTDFRRNQQNQPGVIKTQGSIAGRRWTYQLIYQKQQLWWPTWWRIFVMNPEMIF
jgi:hypothetical protein